MTGSEIGTTCDPVLTMQDLGDKIPKMSLDKTTLRSDGVAFPCGLIAKYFFNDTFALADSTGQRITIDETNIAHSVDKDYKFKMPENVPNPNSVAWLNVTNEHVMVWYQMESFPTFIKLWGHIWTTLKAGTQYTIVVDNKFDVGTFDGKKYIYFSEVNGLGGTNTFLGIAFLAMAGVVLVIMLIFTVLYFTRIHGQDLYSPDKVKW
jgi:hypothetical protein